MAVRSIPEGQRSVTPNLVPSDARAAIAFYRAAFSAEEVRTEEAPGGKILHAELRIGDSLIYLNDSFGPPIPAPAGVVIHLWSEDADALFARALEAGATSKMPLMDAFWGDRFGQLVDPFGFTWSIATHVEDVEADELERRRAAHSAGETPAPAPPASARLDAPPPSVPVPPASVKLDAPPPSVPVPPALVKPAEDVENAPEPAAPPVDAASEPEPAPADAATPPDDGTVVLAMITAVEPSHGPLGGCSVTVRGEGFVKGCVVRVGAIEVSAEREDDRTLRFEAPPSQAPGPVDVRVVTPDGKGELRVNGFDYDAPPRITRLEPAVASIARGGAINVFGEGFDERCTISVGAIAATPGAIEPDRLAMLAPPHAEGAVEIVITNPDGQRATASLRYAEGPVVTRVTPAEVPLTGGVSLVIEGRGFVPGSTVTLFEVHAPTVTFEDETCLKVTAPPHDAEGSGPVRVQTPDGLRFSLANALCYSVPRGPEIRDMAPARGSIYGGTRLTITGSRFDPRTLVKLGAAEGAVAFTGAELIHVVTPAVAEPGVVDVVFLNPDGTSTTLEGGFAFTPPPAPPKFIAIAPARGFGAGGATVSITGDNFEAGVAVRIGEVRTTVRVVSRTLLEVEVPPRSEAGSVAVELIADGVVVRTEDAFLYELKPPPRITDVTPKSGPTTGGTRLTIEGADFPESAYVRIGRDAAKSVLSRKKELYVIVTPPNKAAGFVDIEIGSPETGAAVMKNAFRYDAQKPPTIASVAPPRGAVGGGTELTIAGKDFLAESVVLVGGKPATKVKFVDPQTLEARTPPGENGQMVDVVVRNPDGKEATSKRAFLYDDRYR